MDMARYFYRGLRQGIIFTSKRRMSLKSNSRLFKSEYNKSQYSANPGKAPVRKGLPRYAVPLVIIGGAGAGFIVGTILRDKYDEESQVKAASAEESHKAIVNQGRSLEDAIEESRDLVRRIKDEVGAPAVVVAVSVDGKLVWSEGMGYSDVENRIECPPDAVMRIASISKSITALLVGQLIEQDKLDIDKPISEYLPKDVWPEKQFNNEKAVITTRQLLCHTGGIRHYEKNCGNKKLKDFHDMLYKQEEKDDKKKEGVSEMEMKEYYIKNHYKSVTDSLNLFKNDDLCSKPGTKYLYTTHGYTLVSAVIEAASGKKFPGLMRGLFRELGMTNSFLDENEPLIYNRSKNYIKSKKGRLLNAPYVDCSYKWAGGGLLSTVPDLIKFGNAFLYSYQHSGTKDTVPGILKPETVNLLWTPIPPAKCDWDPDGGYGLGWGVVPGGQKHGCCMERRFYVSHTGGAIGASSAFLVMPRQEGVKEGDPLPKGIVVAMIANMQSVGLSRTAMKIAKIFDELD